MTRTNQCVVAAIATAVVVGIPSPIVHGQDTPSSPARSILTRSYAFTEAHAVSEYKLFVPSSYRAGFPAPLIVALHGSGSDPDEIIHVRGLEELADRRGYLIVAPMGLNPYAGYGSRGPGRAPNRSDDPPNAGALSELDVLNVLGTVQHDYTIDDRRVFLLGHSMGGAGALYLGARYPELWAGMALFAPGSRDADPDVAALRNIPIIMFQGKEDTQVLPASTRRMAALMRRSIVAFEYHEMIGDHFSIIGWTPRNIERAFDFFEGRGRPDGRRLP